MRLLDSNSGKLTEPRRSDSILWERPDNFDLILVDGRQDPPIVRFQSQSAAFKQTLQREEAATRARLANKLKEMHLTTVTGPHDFSVKIGKIEEWILKGWRVKMVIEEKKQSRKQNSIGMPTGDAKKEMMQQIVGKLAGTGEIVNAPELERGCLIFTLTATQKILSQLKQQKREVQDQENKPNK